MKWWERCKKKADVGKMGEESCPGPGEKKYPAGGPIVERRWGMEPSLQSGEG